MAKKVKFRRNKKKGLNRPLIIFIISGLITFIAVTPEKLREIALSVFRSTNLFTLACTWILITASIMLVLTFFIGIIEMMRSVEKKEK